MPLYLLLRVENLQEKSSLYTFANEKENQLN